ncbi:MAG: glycosyltransferase family 2 protein [Deltaproteobacteria bacterium]|nr:glycosyltransferase family 2 protein [Deltaproteobacteria bacterium]
MAAAPWLSVVVPLHDEEHSLEPLHRELDAALAGVTGGVELIFVDDGSRDGSRARLRELAAKDPRVRVLALDRQHGQSAALDAGFRAARGAVVVTLDADGQNDPADIPRLLAGLDRADVVNGVRVGRRDGWGRRASSAVANGFRNAWTRESVTDVGCSLRVMRAETLRRVRLWRGAHRFLPTLLRLAGARVIELPVAHRPRRHGRSKYGVLDRLFAGLADVFGVRWLQSRALHYEAREEPPPRDDPSPPP